MVDLKTEITLEATEEAARLIERDLIGAWRAGYDYFYVAPERHGENVRSMDNTFTLTFRTLPTDVKLTHNPFKGPMTRYDLSEITVEDYQELKHDL